MVNSGPRMGKLGVMGSALAGLVVWLAPLLGGTADRPYTLLVAAACGCACLLTAFATGRDTGRPLRASWFHVWLAASVIVTLLQTVPLPPPLRALLAPGSDPELRQILSGLQPGSAALWWPLSLDPGATLHEAVRLAGYLCLLLALSQGPLEEPTRRSLAWLVQGAASLCAGLGLLAGLGLPLPSPIAVLGAGTTRAAFPAGFYNSNHMAALVGLGALLLLDAAMATAWPRRLGLFGLWALCNVVLVATLSRAGVGVWLLAQAALLAWQLRRRRGPWLPSLVVVLLFTLGAGLALEEHIWPALHQRLLATTVSELTAPGSKLHAWVEAWPLLRGHFMLGVGRGAFEDAFQHVHALAGRMRFVYLENEWLQAVIDWGVPAALLLFALFGRALRDAWRQVRELPQQTSAGTALLGLAALAIHNLFDFSLEVGGVAVAALVLCALCQHARFALARRLAAAAGVLTMAGAALLVGRLPSHDEDGARLRALCERPTARLDEVLSAGRAAVLRHPFDAYLPALVASRLQPEPQKEAQAQAVDWINRALVANPREVLARHAGANLLLASGHRAQGLLLLAGAIADADADGRRRLLVTLASWTSDLDELLAALPNGEAGAELLELLGRAPSPRWPLVRALAAALLPAAPGAAAWLGRSALALRDADAAHAAAMALLHKGEEVPPLLFADLTDLLADSGRSAEAETLARAALERSSRPELLLSLARLAERPGNLVEARSLLIQALGHADDPGLAARIHEVYGELEAKAGNPHQAAAHRLEAARLRQR